MTRPPLPFSCRRLPMARCGAGPAFALGLALVVLQAAPVRAQDVEDVFGEIGVGSVVEEAEGPKPGEGAVEGRVFDGESGDPLRDVTVVLVFPDAGDGSEPHQEVGVTDSDGGFLFPSVPPGTYSLSFIKSGFRSSVMTNFAVEADARNRADFPMPPLPPEAAEGVLTLDEFVVEQSAAEDMMAALELRMDSTQLLNIMSAEDLSKFASSDVAEALKRVSGVNIVEGQFAIIRGLEDRYSSTLYNGAPVPSPDPDRQSVQLDLFPSEVVGNLVVTKTFAPESPSNSAGGSIDIITHDYPDDLEIKISGQGGWESRAIDDFLLWQDQDPLGKPLGPWDVIENEYGASIGGRKQLFGREVRFKGVVNRELDFRTAQGFQEERQPDKGRIQRNRVRETGDLATGDLTLTRGLFDLTQSEKTRQITAFGALGIDLDEDAHHKIDGSVFYTKAEDFTVELRENGTIPGFDYAGLFAQIAPSVYTIGPYQLEFEEALTIGSPLFDFRESDTGPEDGQVVYMPVSQTRSFRRDRDLTILQLNGDHAFELPDGIDLNVTWAGNYAKTSQDESAIAAQYFFDPDDAQAQLPADPSGVPFTPDEVGPGLWAADNDISYNANTVDETQYFGRIDLEQVQPLGPWAELTVRAGGWYEHAERSVDAQFMTVPRLLGDAGNDFAIVGDTVADVTGQIWDGLGLGLPGTSSTINFSTNESEREIRAAHVGGTLGLFDTVELHGGVRIEDIFIQSLNDPFTGAANPDDDGPQLFPSRYLFFDRFDNRNRTLESAAPLPGSRPADFSFNDQILGIQVPVDETTGFVDFFTEEEIAPFINGLIDVTKYLPSAGVTVRPHFHPWLEGLTLRGAWSRTVARPSFREMGYYVTTEPGTDDLIIGNPQLVLSEVESWDARVEYLIGDSGDLVAASVFKKTIDNPIEVIVVRDPSDFSRSPSASTYRTFFNNPGTADLRGIEAEARLHLDLFGLLSPWAPFLEYLSIGGNYTYIDAEVPRSQAELVRSLNYFPITDEDVAAGLQNFTEYRPKRRLFSQPEWIANADISFDNPDWGTRITLAWFAISDVLDAAGSVALQPDGDTVAFVLDRYTDSFYQLDLIGSQEFELPRGWGTFTLKGSVKNLTDSPRAIVYDRDQTSQKVEERRYRIGQDYAITLTYKYVF